MHATPAAHACPHVPQLPRSRVGSTQKPPQSIAGATQVHVLATQSFPPVHATPHAPQLAGSVVVSMHEPLQFVDPVGHVATHVPVEQSGVEPEHAVPQAPQCVGSVCRS